MLLGVMKKHFVVCGLLLWAAVQGLPTAQAGSHPTGYRPAEQMIGVRPGRAGVRRSDARAGFELQSSFDWSTSCTQVRDQGQTGTCWIFGTMGDFEAKVLTSEGLGAWGGEPNYSEKDLGNYFPESSWSATGQGGNAMQAVSYMAAYGVATEAQAPWAETYGTWNESIQRTRMVRNWVYLGDLTGTGANVTTIKQALAWGPVNTSIDASTLDAWNTDWGTLVAPSSQTALPETTNHLVVIVGWDDTKAQTGAATTGAWKVRNSWGDAWGLSGYCWIGYGAAAIGSSVSYFPEDAYEDEDAEVTPLIVDKGWDGDVLGYDGFDDVYFFNKFTVPTLSEGTHELVGVDLIAAEPDMQYEVRVYSGFNGTSLTGQLASKSGTLNNAGYYCVELTEPIEVAEGQTLCLWVHYTTTVNPTEAQVIPITDSRWSQNKAGCCYFSADNGSSDPWNDANSDPGCQIVLRGRIRAQAPPEPAPNATRGWWYAFE